MTDYVTPAIPASQLVAATPGVLPAGGNALDMIAVILTQNTRVPIGTIPQFPDADSVLAYFGAGQEASLAAVYFKGFDNSSVKPGLLNFYQYAEAAVSAYLRGGSLSSMSLTTLQAVSGTLSVTIDGTVQSGSVDLATATSFSDAATLIATALSITSPATVTFDSISQSFVFTSGTTGASSTLAYATGTIAATLNLTQATGAVVSPGADAYTPGGAMDSILAATQNWTSFLTTWAPVSSDAEAFATWVNTQNTSGSQGGYIYHFWDSNVLNTESGGPSPTVSFINSGNLSGVNMIYQSANTTLNGEKAAFCAGMIASIDFTERNGFATFAYKSQSGLLADVTDGTIANYLAGSPSAGTYGYGINFYGDYTTANQAFLNWQRGLVSGPFIWMDDLVGQIWLDNACQLALMELMTVVKRLPYNAGSYAQVELALVGDPTNPGPVSQGIINGVVVPGVSLSSTQIAAINAATGFSGGSLGPAALSVQNAGYYLQVSDPGATVRQSRGSPVTKLWYTNGESIQFIDLSATLVM